MTISTETTPKKGEKLENIIQELEQMIGLTQVKSELKELIDFAKVAALRFERDLPLSDISLHMVFSGPPGTGKTEVARKVGRMLKAIGLLERGHCVEVDRSQMVAAYLGQTAKLVVEKIKDAKGGVLFIDEAYTLSGGGKTAQGGDSYGQEAVDTLLKLMEDNRGQLVVIAAGYTSEMRRFVESNPGLKSRFSRFIEFSSYSADELFQILQGMIEKGGYHLVPDAELLARRHITELRRYADESFGNARAMRQFYESLLPIQARRLVATSNLRQLTDEALQTITVQDLEAAGRCPGEPEKLEDIIAEFERMVGLDHVKRELNQLIAFGKVVALRRQRDMALGPITLHMVFSGPPGTGKTEVARKVGRMLKAIGLLKRGHCVEVDRAQLVSDHAGGTAKEVTEKVKDALDGVLFIDEAYTLNTQRKDFGQEAIDTLLKLMEDNRGRLVVIAAGYTDQMHDFVGSNPGLKSRFSRFIEFTSYSAEELLEIFKRMVEERGYKLTAEAESLARRHIAEIRRRAGEKDFGNARVMRQLVEDLLPVQAWRLSTLPELDHLTDQDLQTFTVEDIREATGRE